MRVYVFVFIYRLVAFCSIVNITLEAPSSLVALALALPLTIFIEYQLLFTSSMTFLVHAEFDVNLTRQQCELMRNKKKWEEVSLHI